MSSEKRILAGWIIDGTGAPARKNVLLRIRNGVFQEVRAVSGDAAGTKDFLDWTKYTVMPALVDAHVHLSMSGTVDQEKRKRQLDEDFRSAKHTISRNLARMQAHGVLAARDGGDRNGYAGRYKKAYLEKEYGSFSLHVAGKAWHKQGRYGSFVGRALNRTRLAEGILKAVDAIDHVKIIQSGLNSLKYFGKETLPQFQLEELKEGVTAAFRLGLKTMVHANGRLPVKIALDAGCDSIEHGFFMEKENLMRMAETGAFWVPTACAMAAYGKQANQKGEERQVAMKTLEHQLEQLNMAKRLGVRVALGTDAGSIGVHHGSAVRDELLLLCEAGFTIEEAVRCASRNGAYLLGLKGKGTLQKGMAADFVAVKGAPSSLPESLNDVFQIHAGERFL